MRVVVTSEEHLKQTPDGTVWATTSSANYSFWERYLAVFDEVLVISRIQQVQDPEISWKPVTGTGVFVKGLPNYLGLSGYVKSRIRVLNDLRNSIHRTDAVILRIPSHVATGVETILRFRRQP